MLVLELVQGRNEDCNELLMEDGDYQVRLKGELTGLKARIWQPELNLEIAAQSEDWRLSLPMALMMPKVLAFMPLNGKHRSWEPQPGGANVAQDNQRPTRL